MLFWDLLCLHNLDWVRYYGLIFVFTQIFEKIFNFCFGNFRNFNFSAQMLLKNYKIQDKTNNDFAYHFDEIY